MSVLPLSQEYVRRSLRLPRLAACPPASGPLVACRASVQVARPFVGGHLSSIPLAAGAQSHISRVAGPGPQAWQSFRNPLALYRWQGEVDTTWQGQQDSNLCMPGSKPGVLNRFTTSLRLAQLKLRLRQASAFLTRTLASLPS